MRIITDSITRDALRQMTGGIFDEMVKAVVDIQRELLAVDADLHADLEALLLSDGSAQEHLWGINLYPNESEERFIEYDSLINIRPAQNNRSRSVKSEQIRQRIVEIINRRIIA